MQPDVLIYVGMYVGTRHYMNSEVFAGGNFPAKTGRLTSMRNAEKRYFSPEAISYSVMKLTDSQK